MLTYAADGSASVAIGATAAEASVWTSDSVVGCRKAASVRGSRRLSVRCRTSLLTYADVC
jgi:hypothetical protein